MFGAEPNLQDWVNRHLYSYNTDVIEHIFFCKWLNAPPCFYKMLISLMRHTVFINGLSHLRAYSYLPTFKTCFLL